MEPVQIGRFTFEEEKPSRRLQRKLERLAGNKRMYA